MARESQGIQIALIIFVMLAIVLGVTTYLYVQRNGELLKAQKDASDRATAAEATARAKDAENGDLKKMMVGAADKPLAEIKTAFDDDMKKYAADLPEEMRVYSKIAERQYDTIKKRDAEITATSAKVVDYQQQFGKREEASKKQLAAISGRFSEVSIGLDKVRTETAAAEEERKRAQDNYIKEIAQIKKTANTAVAAELENRKASAAIIAAKENDFRKATQRLNDLTTPRLDRPGGEITWVNQRTRTVWVDRGRDDHLERQTKFGVYATQAGGMSSVKKADIEVIRVVDEHTAEARILGGDSIGDPVMPGDKIYTPLWSPGEQKHFALAGTMDLDGDGKNGIATVRSLITEGGAVVDCYMDNDGNVVGKVDAGTRVIVLGEAPERPEFGKALKAYGDIISQADRVAATKMTLAEFKEKMGYQKSASVENFGNAANQGDVSKAAAAIKAAPKKPKAAAGAAADTQ